jgi:hypothetical protein
MSYSRVFLKLAAGALAAGTTALVGETFRQDQLQQKREQKREEEMRRQGFKKVYELVKDKKDCTYLFTTATVTGGGMHTHAQSENCWKEKWVQMSPEEKAEPKRVFPHF